VYEITAPAFAAAGDPEMYPDAGVPWAPSKHYETGWTRRRIEAMNAACVARGIESPFADWFSSRNQTQVDRRGNRVVQQQGRNDPFQGFFGRLFR